ncbi:hypothetical protein AMTR_s00099p00035930 [Amborella trichopoda]|uniref:Uncharacterized protein n=1 Tax=Amborella trichopoda TaxID=13333 RepID=W1NWM7_AMBTC|nr:hypothetical protein AMTR_s00099p00035930 [Amborella trichopoda]
MGEVTNLKLRNLGWTPDLESIKHGVISKLSSLEELDVMYSGYRTKICEENFGREMETIIFSISKLRKCREGRSLLVSEKHKC